MGHVNHSDLLADIDTRGFSRLEIAAIEGYDFGRLYRAFDGIIAASTDSVAREIFRAYDKTLTRYLVLTDTPLGFDTLSLGKLHDRFVQQVSSFQYLHGYLGAFTNNFDPLIHDFLVQMDEVSKIVFPAISRLLPQQLLEQGVHGVLKISCYHNNITGPYLIPPHYDRTFLSVVLQTQNEREEQLVVYPTSQGADLKDHVIAHSHVVRADEFPLVFGGIAGLKKLNLKPTAHAVLNFSSPAEQKRHSLIFFILPSRPD